MGQSESKPTEQPKKAEPEPPEPLTYPPWRQPSNWNVQLEESLQSEIQSLHPLKRPNVLTIGPVGAGKSSFINSILSIAKGRKCALAVTGSASSSFTLNFDYYTTKGLLKRYRLIDCMGLEPTDGHGFHPDDIIALLKGHIKKGYAFNPSKPISEGDNFWNPKPDFKDQIHCVVFVISSVSIHFKIPKDYVQKIHTLQDKIRREGIPRVLILTKVDLLCDEARKDITKMFQSVKIQEAVNTASELFCIDKASIHPVKNYEVDFDMNPLTNIPLLFAIRQAMQYAEDRVEHVLDADSDDSD